MNLSTIRTPDIGHICKHDRKTDQSQWLHLLAGRLIRQISMLKRIAKNINWLKALADLGGRTRRTPPMGPDSFVST